MKNKTEEYLVFDPETKEWSGSLPANCTQVRFQFLDSDTGDWTPANLSLSSPRSKTAAIELMEEAARKDQCKLEKYRLVPANLVNDEENNFTNSIEENNAMATKTKKTATTKAPKTANTAELVCGRLRPDSIAGKMVTLLSDGVPRTVTEIARVIKPRSVKNVGTGKYSWLRKFGIESGLYYMSKSEDGKMIQLAMGEKPPAKTAKAAKAKAAPKAAAPKKTAKPTKKAMTKKATKKTPKKSAPAPVGESEMSVE